MEALKTKAQFEKARPITKIYPKLGAEVIKKIHVSTVWKELEDKSAFYWQVSSYHKVYDPHHIFFPFPQ